MSNNQICEEIVNTIIEKVQNGASLPWDKPWKNGLPKNLFSKKVYRGVNMITLAMAPYALPYYATWNQIQEHGGRVKEEEAKNYTLVVFWKMFSPKATEEDIATLGAEKAINRKIPMLRYFRVYNIEQTTGLEKFIPETVVNDPIAVCEEIIAGYPNPPKIRNGEPRAYYRPTEDLVNMPNMNAFEDSKEYYGVLFHELTHSTGIETRLDRFKTTDGIDFGDYNYSVEELVAEFGAAMLCGMAQIDRPVDRSVAYLQGWVKKLKDKPMELFTAAAKAQKAVDHILDVPEWTPEVAETESKELVNA